MNADASAGWSLICALPLLVLVLLSLMFSLGALAYRAVKRSQTLSRVLLFVTPITLCVLGVLGTAVTASRYDSPVLVAAPLLLALVLSVVAALVFARWAYPEWWARRQHWMFPDRVGRSAGWWRGALVVLAVVVSGIGVIWILYAERRETGSVALLALVVGGVLLMVVLPKAALARRGEQRVSFWRFAFSKSGALIFLGGLGVAIMEAIVTEQAILAKLVGSVFIVGMLIWRWMRANASAVPPGFSPPVAPLLLTPDPTQLHGDCPTCLSPIPADSPHGLCPRCLIRGAMPSPSSTRLRRGVSPIEPPTPAEVNDFFSHLEVLELIGAGGMGAVYTARQPALDRVVALKIVQSPRGDDDPVFAERFAREARAMAKLDHPNIVTIHESGEAGGLPFLLMEYVDGVTLREAMVNRLLTTTEALAVIPQVCDALDFAHRHGVVHRDIKPENILIDQTGRVKIADFGLAKLADPKNVTLTRTQQAMGTPHYMAPEQWERPNDVDHRADVYALGVVLYELLTGELPLGRFALPSEMGKGDAKLDQVVIRAMAKDPNERFQYAGQMKAALSGVKLAAFTPAVPRKRKGFEYKSRARFMGMPLVHVVGGRDAITGRKRIAKGWIAVGDLMAVGGIAVGGVTGIGLIGIGGVCGVGLLGLGGACGFGAVGVGGNAGGFLASLGGTSASNGVAVGGVAAGKFAIGGHATGEYVISDEEMTPGFGEALVAWIRGFWPW